MYLHRPSTSSGDSDSVEETAQFNNQMASCNEAQKVSKTEYKSLKTT